MELCNIQGILIDTVPLTVGSKFFFVASTRSAALARSNCLIMSCRRGKCHPRSVHSILFLKHVFSNVDMALLKSLPFAAFNRVCSITTTDGMI